MTDIYLDTVTHDWVFTDGDIQLVTGIDLIIQQIKIRLYLFKGEWPYDTTQGLPFFTDILVKNPDLRRIRSIFYDAIMGTDGVTAVNELELLYDASARTLSISFGVDTIYGVSDISNIALGV